jgi:ribosomal-protein-serine acetyltransferase
MNSIKVDENIELRHFTEADAEDIYSAVKANYDHLRPFLHWVVPEYSLAGVKEFIALANKNSEEKTSEGIGIFYQGRLAGATGFVHFSWESKNTEIGYWIAKEFEGQGIITKSCRALINYAFDDLGMNRIEIRCATVNVRSRAVPERLGFTLEGVLRQQVWRHTQFYDMAIYGLLKEELKG